MHSDRGIAGLPSSRDRDPVAEAVERGAVEWEDERARYHVERYGYVPRPYDAEDLALARRFLRASLAAALAPYGGLEAIKRLAEISQNDSNLKRLIAEYAAEGIGPDGPD